MRSSIFRQSYYMFWYMCLFLPLGSKFRPLFYGHHYRFAPPLPCNLVWIQDNARCASSLLPHALLLHYSHQQSRSCRIMGSVWYHSCPLEILVAARVKNLWDGLMSPFETVYSFHDYPHCKLRFTMRIGRRKANATGLQRAYLRCYPEFQKSDYWGRGVASADGEDKTAS